MWLFLTLSQCPCDYMFSLYMDLVYLRTWGKSLMFQFLSSCFIMVTPVFQPRFFLAQFVVWCNCLIGTPFHLVCLFFGQKEIWASLLCSVFTTFSSILWILPFKIILKPSTKKATSNFCILLFGFVFDCPAFSQICCHELQQFWQLSFKMCLIGFWILLWEL